MVVFHQLQLSMERHEWVGISTPLHSESAMGEIWLQFESLSLHHRAIPLLWSWWAPVPHLILAQKEPHYVVEL